MRRRHFLALPAAAGATVLRPAESSPVLPGIWRFTLGSPERITPVQSRRYPPAEKGFVSLAVTGAASRRGYLAGIPLESGENIYGLGLQLQSFQQRGLKKKLRGNADPLMDSGDTHAPVPFYVTTRGYGVVRSGSAGAPQYQVTNWKLIE